MNNDRKLPLVYSCSGASSAAQMANHIAVRLDRLKVAEMSCIAGVGGDVKPLLRTAKSGRPIIALDGCPLQCAAKILKRHGIRADKHYDLSKMGVKKRQHEDFDPQEAAQALHQIMKDSGIDDHSPATKTIRTPVSGPENTVPSSLPDLPIATGEEAHEPASPVCYLREFKDW
ncbi:MAG: putative zinc-binding protein [Limisphaerales bacterium]